MYVYFYQILIIKINKNSYYSCILYSLIQFSYFSYKISGDFIESQKRGIDTFSLFWEPVSHNYYQKNINEKTAYIGEASKEVSPSNKQSMITKNHTRKKRS